MLDGCFAARIDVKLGFCVAANELIIYKIFGNSNGVCFLSKTVSVASYKKYKCGKKPQDKILFLRIIIVGCVVGGLSNQIHQLHSVCP